jgi:DNA ligase-1
MSEIKRPMLAETCDDIAKLQFPVLATPKLDGIRCLVLGGKALSRKFKEIPNRHIQKLVSQLPEGLDGELMLRPTCDSGQQATFQQVTSCVMSEDGEPDFVYNVFDYVSTDLKVPYEMRMQILKRLELPKFVEKILPIEIANVEELEETERVYLQEGFEGVMVRSLNGPYKCGRSTVREGFLLKIKRFKDSEAKILGFTPRMHNINEATKDELGHTKRSSAKAGLVATAYLGTLKVVDAKSNVEFEIGTGFDDALRKHIWDNQPEYLGKLVKYKSQEIGTKDKPRFPVFLGFRDQRDM